MYLFSLTAKGNPCKLRCPRCAAYPVATLAIKVHRRKLRCSASLATVNSPTGKSKPFYNRRQNTFSYKSTRVRMCETRFDSTDVIRAHGLISGQSVSLQREKHCDGAIPQIFESPLVYLMTPKTRSQSQRVSPSARWCWLSSPNSND